MKTFHIMTAMIKKSPYHLQLVVQQLSEYCFVSFSMCLLFVSLSNRNDNDIVDASGWLGIRMHHVGRPALMRQGNGSRCYIGVTADYGSKRLCSRHDKNTQVLV